MDRSMVVALNMFDELRNSGDTLDYVMLGKMIGVPIVPTVSNSGEGIDDLFDSVIHVFEHKHPSVRHIHVNLGSELENAVGEIKDIIKKRQLCRTTFFTSVSCYKIFGTRQRD